MPGQHCLVATMQDEVLWGSREKGYGAENSHHHPSHLDLHHPLSLLHHHDLLNALNISSFDSFDLSFVLWLFLFPPHPSPLLLFHSISCLPLFIPPKILVIIPTSLSLLNPSHPSAVECRVGRLTWQH